jgi:hypothetical protein
MDGVRNAATRDIFCAKTWISWEQVYNFQPIRIFLQYCSKRNFCIQEQFENIDEPCLCWLIVASGQESRRTWIWHLKISQLQILYTVYTTFASLLIAGAVVLSAGIKLVFCLLPFVLRLRFLLITSGSFLHLLRAQFASTWPWIEARLSMTRPWIPNDQLAL